MLRSLLHLRYAHLTKTENDAISKEITGLTDVFYPRIIKNLLHSLRGLRLPYVTEVEGPVLTSLIRVASLITPNVTYSALYCPSIMLPRNIRDDILQTMDQNKVCQARGDRDEIYEHLAKQHTPTPI